MEKMNKGIDDLKNIRLDQDTKRMIFQNVMGTPVISPYSPKISFWNFMRQPFAYATIGLLILAMTGGGMAYASEGTVPGDLLYSIKVSVTEPIRDALATKLEVRAEWEATKAIRRIDEAEKLASKNKLTPDHRAEIEKRFNDNVVAFNKHIGPTGTSTDNMRTSFEKAMDAHRTKLEETSMHGNDKQKQEVHQLEQKIIKAYPFKNHR